MRLDLFSLNLFADIVETRSIGAGAKLHHIAISAASKRIAELEGRFGTPLLTRHARGVLATEAGEALHRRLRQTLGDLEQIAAEMSEYAQGGRGRVRLACNAASLVHGLPEDLATFTHAHPAIGVDIREHSSHDTLEAVTKGTADVGIVAPVADYPAGLHYWCYHAVPWVLVVPLGHALAGRTSAQFRETLHHEYIGLPAGGGWDRCLSGAAATCGSPLKVRLRVDGFESACRMVEAGLGQSFVPERTALLHVKAGAPLCIVPLEDAWTTLRLSLCSRDLRSLPVAARLLVRHLAAGHDAASKVAQLPSGPEGNRDSAPAK